jgi:proliferating cell nuclear antigen
MFEAELEQASLLKKIVEAVKDLVTDASFDCSAAGLSMQAMDSSHVALCHLMLKYEGFDSFRCDRDQSLGLNLGSLSKVLKCANNEDTLTLKAEEDPDHVTLMFENQSHDKIMDFEIKLMDIDSEHLGIPDTEYKCKVSMDSTEFQRIVRDLTVLGDSCDISCSKEGVTFSVKGDVGTANIVLKQNNSADRKEDEFVKIEMQEPVKLRFALRFLNQFTKATPLAKRVTLSMSADIPLVVEYDMEDAGHLRYYLAPKLDEEG